MSDPTNFEGGALGKGGESHSRGLTADAAGSLTARLFAMALSSVTALMIANSLSRNDYGGYAIVVGLNVLIVMGFDLGMTSSIARYVAQGRATSRLVVTVAVVRLTVVVSVALVVLVFAALPPIDRTAVASLFPALAGLIVAQSLIAFHFGALPALGRVRLLILVTVLHPAVELVLVVWVRAHDGGVSQMLLATALASLSVSVLAWLLLLAPTYGAWRGTFASAPAEHATLAMVAAYGRRILLVTLLMSAFGQVDQMFIAMFHPLASVAPYALAVKIQALIVAPSVTIACIVAPRIVRTGPGSLALYRQWFVFLATVNVGTVLVLCVLSAETFGAVGDQYHPEHVLLVTMGPMLLMSSLAPLPSITLNQLGHAGSRLRVAATTVAINVLIDLLLVPQVGAYGAVIGTTIALGYYLVQHHLLIEDALGRVENRVTKPIGRLLWLGVVAAGVAGLFAAVMRQLLRVATGDPSDLAVLIIAGGLAALAHTAWASRIVRRPFE